VGDAPAGASWIAMGEDPGCVIEVDPGWWRSHSGFKVATMNHAARPTVTVWANRSQRRRIEVKQMNKQSVERNALESYLASALDISRFRDYCPNGVQVEGRSRIETLVSGVTASLDLIEAAR